ncbi:MAG: hypothetical protein NVS3B12_06590 [Acidimicrobiales bacterium]
MPNGWGRGPTIAALAALALLVPTIAVAPRTAAGADVPVVIVNGKGFGHGVGMAQDGAHEMGRRGFNLSQILGQFYPGTSFGTLRGAVRIPVEGAGPAPTSAIVRFPDGGDVRDALSGQQSPGFPVKVPAGGQATISWDGSRYTVSTGQVTTAASTTAQLAPAPPTLPAVTQPTTTTTTRPSGGGTPGPAPGPGAPGPGAPGPGAPRPGATTTTTSAPGGGGSGVAPGGSAPAGSASSTRPLWSVPSGNGSIDVPGRSRAYRGVIEAEGTTGNLRLVNQVDVESYLVGMGEVPGDWPLAAVETQEVAARTYAMRAMAAAGEICDDTRCQVYLGVGGENPGALRAVQGTSGQVLYSGGALADTVYSANAAGVSATREEGFGVSDGGYPYLRAAPYPAGDLSPYSVHVSAADVAARLGLSGGVEAITVSRTGPSGRALEVTVTSGGQQTRVSGLAFAGALGLRSTMIEVHLGADATAPPPPPASSPLQRLPDQVAEVARVAPDAAPEVAPTDASATPPPAALRGQIRPARHRGVPVLASLLALALIALVGAGAARQSGLAGRLGPLARRAKRDA